MPWFVCRLGLENRNWRMRHSCNPFILLSYRQVVIKYFSFVRGAAIVSLRLCPISELQKTRLPVQTSTFCHGSHWPCKPSIKDAPLGSTNALRYANIMMPPFLPALLSSALLIPSTAQEATTPPYECAITTMSLFLSHNRWRVCLKFLTSSENSVVGGSAPVDK